MKKQVTLKTIADELNISVGAVSKALYGAPNISKETTMKVRKLAEELNYQPNSIAKSLRTNETKTIGLIISDSTLLFFASMIEEIEKTASNLGYNIILCNAYSSIEKEKQAVRTLVNKRIDGLMLAASLLTLREHKSFLDSFDVPYIFLVRPPEYSGGNFVMNDNYYGSYNMVDYLIKSGSRRIHFINLSKEISIHIERHEGYRAALEANGITYDDSLVYNVKPFIDDGYNMMNNLLIAGEGIDTVFCGCDTIAVGVMECILERGLKIPDDIRVAAYDDIEFAAYLRVPLTTVRQPRDKIGRIGTEKLIDKIRNKSDIPINMVIKPELVLRKST